MTNRRFEMAQKAGESLISAAVGLGRWDEALRATATACGGDGAVIFSRAMVGNPRVPTAMSDPEPPGFVNVYLAEHRHQDPWAKPFDDRGKKIIGTFLGESVIPDSDLIRTPHYNEVFRHQDVRRILSIGVEARDIELAPSVILSVTRGTTSRPFGDEDFSTAKSLEGAVAVAVNLYGAAQRKFASDIAGVLDGMDGAAAIVTTGLRLVYANALFEQAMELNKDLGFDGGQIRFGARMKQAEIACLTLLEPHSASRASVAALLPQHTYADHAPYVIVAQIPNALAELLRAPGPLVMLKLSNSGGGHLDRIVRLCAATNRLTRAESRVLRHLLDGRHIEEIASVLATSRETIRVQMKSIFRKCRVNRQAELVALALTHFDDRWSMT